MNVFGRSATLASPARSGFVDFATQYSLRGPTFGTRATMGGGGLGKSARVRLRTGYINLVRILDDPGPIKLPLLQARYTNSTRAVRGFWCLQDHVASAFSPGIQRNVDESRGAAVVR